MTTEDPSREPTAATRRRDHSLTLGLLLGSALLAGVLYGGSMVLVLGSMDLAVMNAVPYPILVAMLLAGGCAVGLVAALVAALTKRRLLPLASIGWLIGILAVAVLLWQRGIL